MVSDPRDKPSNCWFPLWGTREHVCGLFFPVGFKRELVSLLAIYDVFFPGGSLLRTSCPFWRFCFFRVPLFGTHFCPTAMCLGFGGQFVNTTGVDGQLHLFEDPGWQALGLAFAWCFPAMSCSPQFFFQSSSVGGVASLPSRHLRKSGNPEGPSTNHT